jgi:hypothetical protein
MAPDRKIRLAEAQVDRQVSAARPRRLIWWAWEDLNFRPHAYQARALTN